MTNIKDSVIGKYAQYCLTALRQTRISTRKLPPSSMEIAVSSKKLSVCYNDLIPCC